MKPISLKICFWLIKRFFFVPCLVPRTSVLLLWLRRVFLLYFYLWYYSLHYFFFLHFFTSFFIFLTCWSVKFCFNKFRFMFSIEHRITDYDHITMAKLTWSFSHHHLTLAHEPSESFYKIWNLHSQGNHNTKNRYVKLWIHLQFDMFFFSYLVMQQGLSYLAVRVRQGSTASALSLCQSFRWCIHVQESRSHDVIRLNL